MPTTWTPTTKPAAPTWTPAAKPATAWRSSDSYLLKEDAFYLLLETGGKIIINVQRSKPDTTWTPISKP